MLGGSEAIGTGSNARDRAGRCWRGNGQWGARARSLLPPPSMGTPAGEVPGARARENPSLSLCFLSVLGFFGLFLGCCRLLITVPPDLSSLIKEPLSGASLGIKINA